jgi:hypothetical protein
MRLEFPQRSSELQRGIFNKIHYVGIGGWRVSGSVLKK